MNLPKNAEQVDKTITLYGYDSLGNRSDPITLTFEIDTRAPVVSVSNLLASSRLDAQMTADGSVGDAPATECAGAFACAGGVGRERLFLFEHLRLLPRQCRNVSGLSELRRW